MDWRVFFIVFGSIFVAELGDKTQLATLLFSSQTKNPWIIFAASASALTLTSFIGVVAGQVLSKYVPPAVLKGIAGTAFIIIGAFILLSLLKK